MKESLEQQIYDTWHLAKNFTRYDLYDVINKVSQLKEYPEAQIPIKLKPLNIEIAMNNRMEVLNLIRAGININKVNEAGVSPLVEAVSLNNYAISKILLQNGSDVNGNENFIPILIAAYYHNDLIIGLLLKYGADATICDKNGFNALHHMFYNSKIRNLISPIPPIMNSQLNFATNLYRVPDSEQTINCINLLVEHGLDINYSSKGILYFGDMQQIIDLNPLSLVLESSDEIILERLIKLGANNRAIKLSSYDMPKEYLKKLDYFLKIKKYDIEMEDKKIKESFKKNMLIKKK